MRLRSLAAVVSTIALTCLTVPASAQDKPAAPAPAPAPAPAAPAQAPAAAAAPAFGSEFTEADRSADAIKKAHEMLAASSKAYQAAPTLAEKIDIEVTMPGAPANSQAIELFYGPKGSFRMASTGVEVLALDGTAYFVPSEPADKYVEKKIEGSLAATLSSMLPGFSMPSAAMSLRDGLKDAELEAQLGGPFVQTPSLKGMRMAGADTELLVAGDGGMLVLVFDGATKLQKGGRASLSPMGAPEGFVISIGIKVTNTVAEKLENPIAFEKGTRTSVASVMDLAGSGGAAAAEPEMKVKVGDDAPVAKLATLEGKEIDLASYKGKVVVLDFWATWCGPCKMGLPLLQKFAESMKGNDKVVVHPVNVWERAEAADRTKLVNTFWTDAKYTMVTLIDGDNKYAEAYGFGGIPTMVIIGTDGKIAKIHTGFDPNVVESLTKDVNEILGAK
jgi:thiol-disulfide isomerase/thioredoxin